MGLGASIVIFAIGAILAFAVEVETSGIDLDAVGVILMIVGIIGLVISLAVMFMGGRREDEMPPTRRF